MAEKVLKKVEADLNCLVCLETYTDPKLLQCHHVFCKGCLRRLVDRDQQGQLTLTCPTCRKVTPVPAGGVAGLQPAFHINHLLEILKEHKKTKGDTCYCPEHPTRELDSFCETCEKLICLECAIEPHQGHKCNLVSKLFEKYKGDIVSSLKPVEDRLTVAHQAMDELNTLHGDILNQQDNLEVKICEHARQIQETAEARKVELINKLHHITGEKLQDLVSQRAEMETTIAQLSSYQNAVHKSLETSSQREVVKMKTTVGQQAKELIRACQPTTLKLNVEADMVFSAQSNTVTVHRSFGDVFALKSPDPEQCHATGKGLQVATVGEKSTAILQTIDHLGEPCKKLIPSLKCKLVSELTGASVRGNAERTGEGQYEISYPPTIKGRNQLHIKISGEHIRGSPFTIAVKLPVKKLGNLLLISEAERPCGAAINQRGEVLITELNTNKVSVLSNGEKLRSFGTGGSGPGHFDKPCGVAVDDVGNILVADTGNHRIQQFTAEGQFLRAVGTKGNGPLQFDSPIIVAFNATNRKIYVVDDNDRIHILNSDLTFSSTFGKHGKGKGQFISPWGIAFDSTGKVYVVDSDNHRIQVFTAEGKFLRIFWKAGEPKEKINIPCRITVDTRDIVYVTQPFKHCVSVFTCEGQFVTSFSTRLKDEAEHGFGPFGLAVDKYGLVHVCDHNSNKVKIF